MPAVTRSWRVLALAWLAIAAVLIARAGLYPAVMTGDEIWFSESAFNFIHHGIPQRLIHSDAVGSARADFLPPVIMLVQALAFLLLGLSPFAVAAQSVAAPLAVIALIFLIARRNGGSVAWAGCAGIAVLGSQIFLRAGIYIRYEALVALFLLLHLWAARSAEPSSRAPIRHLVAGGALALSGLSYYPLAPFIGIAALLFECARPTDRARRLWMVAGFAVPALLFAAYVARFPDEFAAQILGNGKSNYVTFELPTRALDPALWRASRDALPELIGLAGLLALAGWRLRRQTRWARCLFGAALITSLPILIYPFQPRLLAVPVTLALLILAAWTEDPVPWLRRLGRGLLVVGTGTAVASTVLMLATAILQRDGRRYDPVAAALDRLVTEPGPVAIDQRAWLALRAADPTRELHHVMPDWAPEQVRIFESMVLRDPAGGAHFRYLVLNAADAEATIEATPALARAFAQDRFVEIGRVAPAFRPLPWATQPPYDLIVYARR
ncbi:MAG: hypothetical protein WDO24_11765 [Pseudomonadota bacterium]